jgi:hypothetical protein
MEVIQCGTAVPWSGRLAGKFFAGRARGGDGEGSGRHVCEIGPGLARTSCVGTEVMGVASTQKLVGSRIIVDEYLTGIIACLMYQSCGYHLMRGPHLVRPTPPA